MCPINKFCAKAGDAAQSCPANADGPEGSASAARCSCRAGFRNVRAAAGMNDFTGPECVTCREGYFCPAGGAEVSPRLQMSCCSHTAGFECHVATTKTIDPKPYTSTQVSCPTHMTARAGSESQTACVAAAGYTLGDSGKPEQCPTGYYCSGGEEGPKACPAQSTSAAGASSVWGCRYSLNPSLPPSLPPSLTHSLTH